MIRVTYIGGITYEIDILERKWLTCDRSKRFSESIQKSRC